MLLCGHRWNTGARSTETANVLRMRTRTGSTKATQGARTGQHRATTSWAIPTERRACRNGEPLGHRRHTAPRGRSRTAGRGTRWAALPAGPCGTGGRSASVARQTAPAAQLRAAPGERRPQLNARESSDTRSYGQALPRGRWACEAPKGPRTSGGCNASGTRGRRSVLRNTAARVVVRPRYATDRHRSRRVSAPPHTPAGAPAATKAAPHGSPPRGEQHRGPSAPTLPNPAAPGGRRGGRSPGGTRPRAPPPARNARARSGSWAPSRGPPWPPRAAPGASASSAAPPLPADVRAAGRALPGPRPAQGSAVPRADWPRGLKGAEGRP